MNDEVSPASSPIGYDYSPSEYNRNPNPDAQFGPMNVKEIDPTILNKPIGDRNELVKPYSNLCGLLALPSRVFQRSESMNSLRETVQSVLELEKPVYN
jgi:hypothetical protein